MELREHHVPDTEPIARRDAVVSGSDYRFTVLTPNVLRLEYTPDGRFEDRASQRFWYRDLPVPDYEVVKQNERVEIETDSLRLRYDTTAGGFTPESLSIELLGDGTTWNYGLEGDDLGGSLRTVDAIDGATDLEDGLVSRDGWTVIDDADSLVFDEDGWVQPRDRSEAYEDLYFFGYGDEYRTCLREFTELAGDVPMVPRWALGNWWSRYWAYSQDELRDLMMEFRGRDLPLSVCMIDMDWHVIENDYHPGWTGWTWNRDLFPDPSGFVDWLHEAGLHTGLNLHPAGGIHPHEDQYEDVAEFVGVDPDTQEPIEFDAADPQFLESYFEHIIHPMEEEEGVDFWWIDWQQWDESPELPGLDPLWALNHLHALDRARDGRRPFILSRWPGLGGHRYPVQFSGDARSTWDSLSFQPYLTATSANVDCGWWSHDIGGHAGGTGDPVEFGELYARWTQFGVFSPINRIHTGKYPFIDKRPWQFGEDISTAISDALQLRHALIPYLYTMARRNYDTGCPPIEPLYYEYPDEAAAYACSKEYLFGTELLVAPHVAPQNEATNLSRRSVWLPEGDWFDFFSGEHYDSGWHARYGDLQDRPVYAPAGAIVPLGPEVGWGGIEPPETLRLFVFPGDDNTFELYEDDGISQAYRDGEYATTDISQHWDDDRLEIEVGPATGAVEHVPDKRDYEFHLRGIVSPDNVYVNAPGYGVDPDYHAETDTLELAVTGVPIDESFTVVVESDESTLLSRTDRTAETAEWLLRRFSLPVSVKTPLRHRIEESPEDGAWLREFSSSLEPAHIRALAETLYDVGVERVTSAEFDRLVLWNESEREDVRYRFSAWNPDAVDEWGDARHGQVPEFKVIDLDEWDADDWEFTMSCGDVVFVMYEDD